MRRRRDYPRRASCSPLQRCTSLAVSPASFVLAVAAMQFACCFSGELRARRFSDAVCSLLFLRRASCSPLQRCTALAVSPASFVLAAAAMQFARCFSGELRVQRCSSLVVSPASFVLAAPAMHFARCFSGELRARRSMFAEAVALAAAYDGQKCVGARPPTLAESVGQISCPPLGPHSSPARLCGEPACPPARSPDRP